MPRYFLVEFDADAGAVLQAYDPAGMKEAAHLLPGVVWTNDAYSALTGVDCAVIITEWNEFRALDLRRVKEAMASPTLVDLRNVYNPAEMARAGFRYSSIGRPGPIGSQTPGSQTAGSPAATA